MTLAEKFELGGQVTGLGLLVVFVCLVLIIVVITVLARILKDKPQEAVPQKTVEIEVPQQVVQPEAVQPVADEELLAVLTAAVAAAMGPSKPNLVVRSYRRINNAPAWERASKNEQIFNKF